MDGKLISWAHAVKARQRRRFPLSKLPPLWVFSDRDRLPDPAPVLMSLPKGLCGLVLRPGGVMPVETLQRSLAVCRARRFPVVLAAPGGGMGAGRHFPRSGGILRHSVGLRTAAAHDPAELVRAARAGVDCVFLSPAFATQSHLGARGLGPLRWNLLALRARGPVVALGGITALSVRRLSPLLCRGAAVIGAAIETFVASPPQCSANAMPKP
jgi:thiamine-phosphate pyrophosphorylase